MAKEPGEVKSVDLETFDTVEACNKPVEIELKHPVTGAKLGAFISIIGRDSDEFRQEINNRVNENLRKASIAARQGQAASVRTVEDGESENIELLVLCTKGFRNITFEGQSLSFSVANALKLYTKLKFVRDQVDAAIADISNFMKA